MCNTGRGPPSRNPRPGHITRRIGPPVPSPLLTGPVLLLCRFVLETRAVTSHTTMTVSQSDRCKNVHLPGRVHQITEERIWKLDEDPAQGIPYAGVALR